ncbi:MAG: hypothetical protein AB7G47_21825 [Mycolicibacterium sp.]|uniref:hypothetical protein n=1 Tax=Mycolicibacterium sp. TaxID=2320850 RepID=UPI003D14F76C
MTSFARLIALPVLAAGIIGGAGLGMAGTAGATVSVDNHGGIVATPDVHAHTTMMYPRWNGYYWPNHAVAPNVDTTVQHSR